MITAANRPYSARVKEKKKKKGGGERARPCRSALPGKKKGGGQGQDIDELFLFSGYSPSTNERKGGKRRAKGREEGGWEWRVFSTVLPQFSGGKKEKKKKGEGTAPISRCAICPPRPPLDLKKKKKKNRGIGTARGRKFPHRQKFNSIISTLWRGKERGGKKEKKKAARAQRQSLSVTLPNRFLHVVDCARQGKKKRKGKRRGEGFLGTTTRKRFQNFTVTTMLGTANHGKKKKKKRDAREPFHRPSSGKQPGYPMFRRNQKKREKRRGGGPSVMRTRFFPKMLIAALSWKKKRKKKRAGHLVSFSSSPLAIPPGPFTGREKKREKRL